MQYAVISKTSIGALADGQTPPNREKRISLCRNDFLRWPETVSVEVRAPVTAHQGRDMKGGGETSSAFMP